MMNLFKFVHAACLPLVLGALCFTGCGDDGYSRAGVDAKDPGEGGSSVQYVLKKKSFRVQNAIPSEWFTADTRAVAYALDSSLNVIDTVEGSALDSDGQIFEFPEHNYQTPYVMVTLSYTSHIWSRLFTGRDAWFSVITDISEVEKPRVDLMTDIEAPMIWEFVSEDYSFSEAKKKAMQNVAKAFGFTEKENQTAETYARPFEEVAGLYAYLLRGLSESSFAQNKSYLKEDLSDGTIDDTDKNIEFADFIIKNRLTVDSLLDRVDSTVGVNKWKFFDRMVEEAFGLPDCKDRLGKVDSVANSRSSYYRDSLVCDAVLNKNDSLVYFRRLLSSLEKQFGPCVPTDSTVGVPALVKPTSRDRFKCLNEFSTFGLSKDSSHMEFKNDWVEADDEFVLNYYLGKCDSVGKKGLYKDSVYVCEYSDWYKKYYWQFKDTDTLIYYLGVCDTGSLWNLGELPDGLDYVCTYSSQEFQWTPANDITMFLSQQPKCNRETDLLRSFSFKDMLYYVCADVEFGALPAVYTFKNTTQSVADSLAFIASLDPCKPSDSLKYVYDSTGNVFYHCETRDGKFQYYEVDEKDGRLAMCGEFVKTLDACTAQSDSTDIIACPYNVTEYETSINVFYHCTENGGKYSYAQVDYWDLDYYASLKGARTSKFCDVVGDTLQYMKDSLNFFYYCAKKGDNYYLQNVRLDTLREMLAEEYLQRAEPCDSTKARWRSETKEFFDSYYYYVCDYDTNANFTLLRVSGRYESNYMTRADVSRSHLKLNACSSEQIAARGTPVEVQDGYITDPRDERRYRVVTIGKQTWMAENLNYYDIIANPKIIDPEGCPEDADLCEATGRRYYWRAAVDLPNSFTQSEAEEQLCSPVQGLCPAGWHIPAVEEWSQLFQYVSYHNGGAGYGAGLKGKTGWYSSKMDDIFGFSANPVTWASNEYAHFVTADAIVTTSSKSNFGVQFSYSYETPDFFNTTMSRKYSVRCVKD